jgi:hypothetical protein
MRRTYSDDESLATEVKRRVAEMEECRVEHLETLDNAVDVERLEQLVTKNSSVHAETPLSMTFTYCGYLIEVESNGTICIEK